MSLIENTTYRNVTNTYAALLDDILKETEDMFFYLVEKSREINLNINAIIQKPDIVGTTCFDIASCFSKRIAEYILGSDIEVHTIRQDMTTPSFRFKELATTMLKKETQKNNKKVIDHDQFKKY